MLDHVLTLPEVAVLLKVSEKTVCTLARGGQIPTLKVRGQERFKHHDIDRWTDEQKASVKEYLGKGVADV
jgi:excisionase family DNA binding protein